MYLPTIPKSFFTYSNTCTATSTEKSILNYCSCENGTNPKYMVFSDSGENVFYIDKNCYINIGPYNNNDMIKTGAAQLSLYSQDKIYFVNSKTTTQLKITVDYIIFTGEEEKFNSILSRGHRTSVTDNEVIFHKPRDSITNNYSTDRLKLLFNQDFSNWENVQTQAMCVEDLDWFVRQVNDRVSALETTASTAQNPQHIDFP
jgi:hypothetical protein